VGRGFDQRARIPWQLYLGNGRINIVFQRDDGNVGWIDPANLPES
jgi:hypothetical protein